MLINEITGVIVDSAIYGHAELGPDLLENTYEACLLCELESRGFSVQNQLSLPVIYKNTQIDSGYRIDLLVDDEVLVELKAVDKLLPIHRAQLLTYLKLSQ